MSTNIFFIQIAIYEIYNFDLPSQKLIKELIADFSAVPLSDDPTEKQFSISMEFFDLFIEKYAKKGCYFKLTQIFNGENRIWNPDRIVKHQSILKSLYWTAWEELLVRKDIIWTEELIAKVATYIDFSALSSLKTIQWGEKFIEKYINKWNWEKLSGNTSLPWGGNLLEKFENKWIWKQPAIQGDCNKGIKNNSISSNTEIKWDICLFEKWIQKLDYWVFASFANSDDDIIIKYPQLFIQKKCCGTVIYKSSDNHSIVKVMETGFEQFPKNSHFLLTKNLVEFAKGYKVNVQNLPIRYGEGIRYEDKTLSDIWNS